MRKMLCALLLVPTVASAQTAFVARCGEPKGVRFDLVGTEVQQKNDGFTGVNPTFIYSIEAPNKLTFVWGPADWARDALKLRDKLQDAEIISRSEDKITAVRIDESGVTQMYSLYPRRGLVYFTQHRYIAPHMGGVPSMNTFYSKCEFAQ